jgi:hypothetical protein
VEAENSPPKMNPKVNGTFFASIRTNYGADAINRLVAPQNSTNYLL